MLENLINLPFHPFIQIPTAIFWAVVRFVEVASKGNVFDNPGAGEGSGSGGGELLAAWWNNYEKSVIETGSC